MRRRPLAPLLTLVACLAAAPATRPAGRPPTGDAVSIGNDLVRFFAPPPPDWSLQQTPHADPDMVYFQTAKADAAIEVQLAPADFQILAGTANQFAAGIVKSLKLKRQQAGQAFLLEPKVMHDHRFDIMIHERFQVGDAVQDQMHLYKSVGPRTVMVTASSVAADPATVTATFKAATDALASAKYNRKAYHKKT